MASPTTPDPRQPGSGAASPALPGEKTTSLGLYVTATEAFARWARDPGMGIIDHLRLREPVYLKTAAYGHFGREEFAWERVDATDELLAATRKR